MATDYMKSGCSASSPKKQKQVPWCIEREGVDCTVIYPVPIVLTKAQPKLPS